MERMDGDREGMMDGWRNYDRDPEGKIIFMKRERITYTIVYRDL